MTSKTQSLQDDLAFMRGIAEGVAPFRSPAFGASYLAGGLIYGAQLLFHWGQAMGWIRLPQTPSVIIALGFTVVFLVALAAIQWSNRGRAPGGFAARALGAAFAAAGTANCAMIALFGIVAARHHSLTIWMLYPAVVFALQGAVWFIAAMLQRRMWMAVIALGWFGSAIGLGLTIDGPGYIVVCGVSLLVWMAIPGAVMLHQARKAA